MLTILLGITGSISAYKIPELIRDLKKKGYRVIPILTQSASQFVTKLTLETVSEEKVWTDADFMNGKSPHLMLTREADIMLTVPCSANTLTKYTYGISDSLLTTCFISFTKSKIIAPAMHTEMWQNSATQRNITNLIKEGVTVVGPSYGKLACGDEGEGRLVDLTDLEAAIQLCQYPKASLQGQSILITAGGTSEAIDPVRAITNRSTGQLGHKLSIYAALMGAQVQLITTKPLESNLPNISVTKVKTADEMSTQVQTYFKTSDCLYMAAAVSDFTSVASETKIRRQDKKIC